MAQFNLKRSANIRQKDKDVVNGFMKEVECLFPADNPFYIISDLIKHLCLLYFHHVIKSKLLTDKEQAIFMKLLQDHNKIDFDRYEWKLIYRASRDGLSEQMAKSKYENKLNLVGFIHTKNDNIMGGYTSVGWRHAITAGGKYFRDEKAFVFNIRSSKGYQPVLRNVNIAKCDKAMFSRTGYYLIWDGCIYINGAVNQVQLYDYKVYDSCPTKHYFNGGTQSEDVKIKLI